MGSRLGQRLQRGLCRDVGSRDGIRDVRASQGCGEQGCGEQGRLC